MTLQDFYVYVGPVSEVILFFFFSLTKGNLKVVVGQIKKNKKLTGCIVDG